MRKIVTEEKRNNPNTADGTGMRKKVIIPNRAGLHARPISQFVETASHYESSLTVCSNGQTVDGKSIIQLMTLAAGCGTELELVSKGKDAEEMLFALERLVLSGFDED
jgi:phosphocarrier protein